MNLTRIRLDIAAHDLTSRSNRYHNRELPTLTPNIWKSGARGLSYSRYQRHFSQSGATGKASDFESCSPAGPSCKGNAGVVTLDLETSTASGPGPDDQGLHRSRSNGSAPRTWINLAQSTASDQQRLSSSQQIIVLTFNVLADGLDVHGDFVKVTQYDTTCVASLHDTSCGDCSLPTNQSHSPYLQLYE